VHERGSQGLSASLALVGGANSPLLELVVVVVWSLWTASMRFVEVVVVVVAWGAFTEKLVPVSTVTSAPPSTMDGSYPRMTDPDMERATICAAATTDEDLDP
jgi:hypothetical protein